MILKTTNLRKIRCFEKKCSLAINKKETTFDNADIDFRLNNINNLFLDLENNPNINAKKEILDLKIKVELELIPDNNLNWISKKDKRLCYFIWSYLRLANKDVLYNIITNGESIFQSTYLIANYVIFRDNTLANDSIYIELGLNEKPSNIDDIHSLIINYIDDVNLERHEKEKLLNNIYIHYSRVEMNHNHHWINKNDNEQLEWIINYMYKNSMSINFMPLNEEQRYYTIVSALDLWGTSDNDSFIKKMKKTWQQNKYRLNSKNEEIKLKKSIIKKLNLISNHYSKNHSEVIEILVAEKYKDIMS